MDSPDKPKKEINIDRVKWEVTSSLVDIFLSWLRKNMSNNSLKNKTNTYIPAVKWDLWRNDMSTVLANEEFDSVIEESWSMLREYGLALLNEVKRVWWSLTEWTHVAVTLLTTIRVHTVSQTIWKRKGWNLVSKEAYSL